MTKCSFYGSLTGHIRKIFVLNFQGRRPSRPRVLFGTRFDLGCKPITKFWKRESKSNYILVLKIFGSLDDF